jgi:hypothetical protein
MNLGLGLFLGARSSGAIFDPSTVANMLIRYRASQAVTSSGGTLIDSIPNEGTLGHGTSNVNDLAFFTARPNYVASSANFNARPSCKFANEAQALQSGALSSAIAQPSTFYAYTRIIDTNNATSANVRVSQTGSTASAATLRVILNTDQVQYCEAGPPTPVTTALYGKRLTCVVYNGDSAEFYIDDMTTTAFGGTAGIGTAACTGFRVGFGLGSSGTLEDFELVEQIGYSGIHNAATRALIKSYFTGTYG